jgi:uncharacterized BrkB/YihY/UPF0761 family membrane protein
LQAFTAQYSAERLHVQCTALVFCITSVESHDTASTEVHGCNVCRRYKFVVSSLLVFMLLVLLVLLVLLFRPSTSRRCRQA